MTFLTALLPVIALVALGRVLASLNVLSRDGWQAIERLSLMVLFPALIILVLSTAEFEKAPLFVALSLIGAQLLMGAVALLAALVPRLSRPAVGSIIQSNVRWNTFIALSLAGSLYGAEGVAIMAIISACMIPTANILSVYGFSHFGDNGESRRNPFGEMLRNPLIIACAIGLSLNVLKIPPTGLAEEVLELLSRGTVPLGLLAAGAGINFASLWAGKLQVILWSVVRLLGLPIIAGAVAVLLGVGGVHLALILIAASTPTAANGYVLARQMGGDADLTASLIALQTVLAIVTMPLFYYALR